MLRSARLSKVLFRALPIGGAIAIIPFFINFGAVTPSVVTSGGVRCGNLQFRALRKWSHAIILFCNSGDVLLRSVAFCVVPCCGVH